MRRLAHGSHRRGQNGAGRGNGVAWTLSRDFRAGEKCERCRQATCPQQPRAPLGGQASGHGRSRSGLATEIAEHLVVCHAITRGVARIPRLEVVGAIEVEQLRPVGFPFDQDRFSTDEGLGGDFRREGKEVAAMGRNHRGEGEAHQSDAPFGHCKGLFLFRAFQGYSGS